MSPPGGEELWSVLVLAAVGLACRLSRRVGWLAQLLSGDDGGGGGA